MSDRLVCLRGGMVVPLAVYTVVLAIEGTGHRLAVDGGDILITPGGLDPALLAELKRWKAHAIRLLAHTASDLHHFDDQVPAPELGPILNTEARVRKSDHAEQEGAAAHEPIAGLLRMAEESKQKLTFRHAAFVAEFLKDCNATAAYRRVYRVGGHGAESSASRLMKRPDVKAVLDAALSAQLARINAEREALETQRRAPSLRRWGL